MPLRNNYSRGPKTPPMKRKRHLTPKSPPSNRHGYEVRFRHPLKGGHSSTLGLGHPDRTRVSLSITQTRKIDPINLIAARRGLPAPVAQAALQAFLDVFIENLSTAGRQELKEFEVFQVCDCKAMIGSNPKTGQRKLGTLT